MFKRRHVLQIVTAELQTANLAYFQRKIQLSVFFAYPDGSPSQLIRIIGVLLYNSVLHSLLSIFTEREWAILHVYICYK